MDITSRAFADVVVIAASGRVDHATAGEFERAVNAWLDPSQSPRGGLVFDFERVVYISSVGLRVLMIAGKAMRAAQARIAVAALQPDVAEILQICRFDAVVETFPAVRAALAALSPAAAAAYDAAAQGASS